MVVIWGIHRWLYLRTFGCLFSRKISVIMDIVRTPLLTLLTTYIGWTDDTKEKVATKKTLCQVTDISSMAKYLNSNSTLVAIHSLH